jgi:hypothetical protein
VGSSAWRCFGDELCRDSSMRGALDYSGRGHRTGVIATRRAARRVARRCAACWDDPRCVGSGGCDCGVWTRHCTAALQH